MAKDNSTLALKAALRRNALREVAEPVVMETHGGYGRIWWRCYQDVKHGIVFEKKPDKAAYLAQQRPTWAVYECDCVMALAAGVGAHLAVNFLDLDPYGEPWPVVDAFFQSERPWPDRLAVVVNDGLRQKVRYGGAWETGSLQGAVQRYGNVIFENYLAVCRDLLEEKAAQAGYRLSRWTGYYTGKLQEMTHYAAVFVK